MKKNVIKIGGSNLKGATNISKLIYILKNYEGQTFIVLSAFYGVTKKLSCFLESINDKNYSDRLNELIAELKIQTYEFIKTATDDFSIKSIIEIDNYFQNIKEDILLYIANTNLHLKAQILAYGEKISTESINYVFKQKGLNFEILLPELGLFTDGDPLNGTVNLSLSKETLLKKIKPECNYLIPGFYGISEEKQISLLGIGGSDYSASSIANILDADALDIWKDVDGYRTADPKLVENTQFIDRLKYDEAAELSYFGAKILHPRTVEPLKEKNIPVRLFNIEDSENLLKPKTIINAKSQLTEEVVKSITFNNNFGILKLKGAGLGQKPGVLAKITKLIGDNNINIKSVITSQTQINILLAKSQIEQAKEIVAFLNLKTISRIETQTNISVIALIGEGVIEKPGIAASIFGTLGRNNINVQLISFGASDVAVYFIVDEKDVNQALQLTHQAFFKKQEEYYYKLEPYDTF